MNDIDIEFIMKDGNRNEQWPAVPRIGDTVEYRGQTYRVFNVVWDANYSSVSVKVYLVEVSA